jgi:hypothetical protein
MWCSTCQQDVPSLGSSGGSLRCGKCGRSLASEASNDVSVAGTETQPQVVRLQPTQKQQLKRSPIGEPDWALEAELRGVQRLIRQLKSSGTLPEDVAYRLDRAEQHSAESSHTDHTLSHAGQQTPPFTQFVAWLLVSLGLAVFACGAVLLGWSLIGGRGDLWPLGMPMTLLGQAGLVLGLILQLDGLWHSSRKTEQTLQQLDGELKTVRQATTLLSTTKSGAAQSFYLHLAEGASPQLLLSDLKGQMDLLAQQMSKRG